MLKSYEWVVDWLGGLLAYRILVSQSPWGQFGFQTGLGLGLGGSGTKGFGTGA